MLTPLDIENKKFKKVMMGVDPQEVDDYLRMVLSDYEKIFRRNIELEDRLSVLDDALNRYKEMENTMQNAIMVAQKAGDDLTRAAHEKANVIVGQTKVRISEAIAEANTQIHRLEEKYDTVRAEFETYKVKMSAMLRAQQELLDSVGDISQIVRKDDVTNVARLFEDAEFTEDRLSNEREPSFS
jgi:DivIVA domain